MTKLRLNSECIGCSDRFIPNDDGVPLCGYCRNNVAGIRERLRVGLAVTMASVHEQILRLSEADAARLDAIYTTKTNLPRAGTTTDELTKMYNAHTDFALRIAATKRKGDALSAVLRLQDDAKALQNKLHSLETLVHII